MEVRNFGEALFSGSRFIFWALSPFLLLFAAVMTLTSDWASPVSTILVVACDAVSVLLILALYSPKRFWWAARGATAIVFLAYAEFLVETLLSPTRWRIGPPSSESPITALKGFSVIGIPCLLYTVLGRFGKRPADGASKCDPREP